MQSGFWDRNSGESFHDKAFRRHALPPWDERWHALSLSARQAFLKNTKTAVTRNYRPPLRSPADGIASNVLEELKSAGFIKVEPGNPPSAIVPDEVFDFSASARALDRFQLLRQEARQVLPGYVNFHFNSYDTTHVLRRILEKAGIAPHALLGDVFQQYVIKRRWPDWVAAYLDDPLARPVLEAIEAAGGRMRLLDVHTQLPGRDRAAVRATVDRLINHLALFEDLGPNTNDVLVGLLPAVRADREQARQERPRPALETSAPPPDVGLEGGSVIPDLRALLLELAAGRVRLKQDRTPYQKEQDRLLAVLDPMPKWYADATADLPEKRLQDARRWGSVLDMVRERIKGESVWLELTNAGKQWLTLGLEEQYGFVFEFLRTSGDGTIHQRGDELFLSSDVTAVRNQGDPRARAAYRNLPLKPAERQPLRDALHAALRELPAGTFVALASFLAHATYGRHNPVLLGLSAEKAEVRLGGRLLPPFEEHLEDAGRQVLRNLLEGRLLGLGCVQPAMGPGRAFLIARLPRLDAYFGHAVEKPAGSPSDVTRVIVQPDFSIIIIGLSPAPMADLAPFCERVRGSVAQGSVTFKLTREGVVRAVADGLPGAEIVARLERHASTPLPRNVAHEVREWCEWVRTVTAEPVTVLRCPDVATADRVQSALGRKAERAGETTVLFPLSKLTSAERQKLLNQGVLLGKSGSDSKGRKKKKK